MKFNTALSNLKVYLENKGYTEEQIEELAKELIQKSSALLYTEAMAHFTEEDMSLLDSMESEDDVNKKIAELFTLRTGRDVAEALNDFLTKFSEEYMKEEEKDSAVEKP